MQKFKAKQTIINYKIYLLAITSHWTEICRSQNKRVLQTVFNNKEKCRKNANQ